MNLNEYDVLIGARFREERLKRKMSLADVGNRFNVSRQSIFKYEKGQRGMPLEMFFKMLEFYDLNPNQFVKEIIAEAEKRGL